jgi:hypothetical protein
MGAIPSYIADEKKGNIQESKKENSKDENLQ